MFGSLNEKIYLTEAQAKATHFVPSSFPGATVRRALGTPFMGYSGIVFVVQEMVNRFYDMVFNFLPFDNVAAAGQLKDVSNPLASANKLVWSDDGRKQMEDHLEGIPWLSRISATRELRTQVELYAVKNGLRDVTGEVVEKALMN